MKKSDYEKRGFYLIDEIVSLNKLVTKNTKLLVSLIEGVANPEIIDMLCENLDFNFLLRRLSQEYEAVIDRIKNKIQLGILLNIIILIKNSN